MGVIALIGAAGATLPTNAWRRTGSEAGCDARSRRTISAHGWCQRGVAPYGLLVQKLPAARRELALEAAIARLEKYHLLILDDLAYVARDQAETSVLFERISARYERRSLLINANHPFGEWGKVFPDPAMTLAAVDRLVHHATIFEMNVDSYRRRTAIQSRAGPGRPPGRATISENDRLSRGDHQASPKTLPASATRA